MTPTLLRSLCMSGVGALAFCLGCGHGSTLSAEQANQRAAKMASAAPATGPVSVLQAPKWVPLVKAVCTPPKDWTEGPPEQDNQHTAVSWLSPSKGTIYGVIQFGMPFSVPLGWVHSNFISAMAKREGSAEEVSHVDDPKLPGIRFDVKGGKYHMRANLMEIDNQGWIIYASTRAGETVNEAELKVAIDAREHTAPSLKAPSTQPAPGGATADRDAKN